MVRKRESTSLSLACETKLLLEEFTEEVRSRINVPIHPGIIVDKIVQLVTMPMILDAILQDDSAEEDRGQERKPEPEHA